jgi:hypothetical protein
MTLFDTAGKVLRAQSWSAVTSGSTVTDIACAVSGHLALLTAPVDSGKINYRTGEGPVLRGPMLIMDSRGNVLRTLPDVPYGEIRPLGKHSVLAVGPAAVFFGTNETTSLSAYAFAADSSSRILVESVHRVPTHAEYSAALDEAVPDIRNDDSRKQYRHQLGRIPMPDWLPWYGQLLAAADGSLWAMMTFAGDTVTRVERVLPHTSPVLQIEIPRGLHLFEIGADYVLGSWQGKDGRTEIGLWKLSIPPE